MNEECSKEIDKIIKNYDKIFDAIKEDDVIIDLIEEETYEGAKSITSDDFYNIIFEIEQLFKKDTIILYREICVDDVKKFIDDITICKKGAGIYWTDDMKYAESYWCRTNENNRITLEANVKCEDINLFDTIVAGLTFYFYNEREIRLKEGSEIFLKRIHVTSERTIEMGVPILA